MMQHQLLQPSWEYYNTTDSPLDMDFIMGDCELSTSFATTEDSSDVSSILYFPAITPDNLLPIPVFSEDVSFTIPLDHYSSDSDDLGLISNDWALCDEIKNVCEWVQGSCETSQLPSEHSFNEQGHEASLSSSMNYVDSTPDITSEQSSLVFPSEDTEVDNQLSIPCLLKAYGDAIENEQAELAEVLSWRVKEKVSPIGTTMERLAYYLFQASDKQGDDYLRQESSKNYGAALRAFYEILPLGRFAHLTANLAILESIPLEVEIIHIIDFDISDAVQLPPLIEAIGQGRAVRITSIKWKEDFGDSPQWSFQDTKRRLCKHAHSSGLKLKVDEMDLQELWAEKQKMNLMARNKEWLAFNCMVALPHMEKQRSRGNVTEFLNIAKELIQCKGSNSTRGIITLGEGDGLEERMKNCNGFGSFLDEYLVHFHALFQAIEWHFPSNLAQAGITLECLFAAPYISSNSCFAKWKQIRQGASDLSERQSWKFSRENLLQAQQLVKQGNSIYSVKIGGANENVMSLDMRGTPLVKVSNWR